MSVNFLNSKSFTNEALSVSLNTEGDECWPSGKWFVASTDELALIPTTIGSFFSTEPTNLSHFMLEKRYWQKPSLGFNQEACVYYCRRRIPASVAMFVLPVAHI